MTISKTGNNVSIAGRVNEEFIAQKGLRHEGSLYTGTIN